MLIELYRAGRRPSCCQTSAHGFHVIAMLHEWGLSWGSTGIGAVSVPLLGERPELNFHITTLCKVVLAIELR